MTIYNDVFGGANIYPSDVSYSAVVLSADITLSWPEETSSSANLATRIMDVAPSSGLWSIVLPAATGAGTGQTILFNNTGANSFSVKDAAGVAVVTVAPGAAWQVYLTDNSTAAGAWESFQFGASLSSANAAALAGTGIVATGTLLSQSVPVSGLSSDYSAGVNDRAKMFLWSGAAGTFTLPDPATVGNNWFLIVRNSGTGALLLDPAGGVLIDGATTKSYQPGESSIVTTDGAAYYTIGYGKSATFAFDYTSISVAGTGNYTLSGTELNRIAYSFTGVLTGNRVVIVPTTIQQYWVTNNTTGPYTLTIKTAAGTGYTINAAQSGILYCNGVNVVQADTAGIAVPLSIVNGGTGAITAAAARTNLGATSTGEALFTAATPAAAWAALGNDHTITGGTY